MAIEEHYWPHNTSQNTISTFHSLIRGLYYHENSRPIGIAIPVLIASLILAFFCLALTIERFLKFVIRYFLKDAVLLA